MKKVLIILLVVILIGAAVGGFFIYRHVSSTIGRDAAVQIALKDAGLERNQVHDLDVEYEHGYYEVEFESGKGDFAYRIDASNGAILKFEKD